MVVTPFLVFLGGRLRRRVELGREGFLRRREVAGDLVRGGHVGLDAVAVVHGPPVVVLQPVAGAEMVHVHDALADSLAFGVESLHADEEVRWAVRIGAVGVLLGIAVFDVRRLSALSDGLDLLGGHFRDFHRLPLGLTRDSKLQFFKASQVRFPPFPDTKLSFCFCYCLISLK